jgi:hypothetical protein
MAWPRLLFAAFSTTRRQHLFLLFVAVLAAVAPPRTGDAALVHDFARDADYRAYGNSFDSVLWGYSQNAGGTIESVFSGVLVDQYWVLTAAHAVGPTTASMTFGTGSNIFSDPGTSVASSIFYVHPTYTDVLNEGSYDLAMVRLTTPLPATPIPLYTGPILTGDYSVVGFGRTGVSGGATTYDGNLRGGINYATVRASDKSFGYQFVDSSNANYRELGSLVQPGDSGGGFFFDDGSGFKVAGITSAVATLPGSGPRPPWVYGDFSFASDIDIPWVNGFIATTAVPEPHAVVATFVLGASFFARRQRQKRRRQNEADPATAA